MNDTISEVTINIKTEEESATQGEERLDEKNNKDKEKPLEKMTKAELLQKIKDLQKKSTDNYNLYLRSQAEIENLKKRTRKEKDEWVKYSNETLIKEILPVMDNLEKAITHSDDEGSHKALKEGVELTFKGLRDTLIKSGLEEVKAKSEPFDPCFHQAVAELEDKNVKAGIILKELQRGYILNQRLIRPAMVVVNKGKPGNETNHDSAIECTNRE